MANPSKSPLVVALWAAALTAALIAVVVWTPVLIGREVPAPNVAAVRPQSEFRERRERYGPPPGRARAISPEELAEIAPRGVYEWDRVYEASSAGAIAHYIERTA